MRPLVPRDPVVGYNLRPHSSSSVGHGEAELKPGTGSSERSLLAVYQTLILKTSFPQSNFIVIPISCHFTGTGTSDGWGFGV